MADKESKSLRSLSNPENTAEITSESSTTESKVRRCFKPRRYHLRRVKNRGAILILIWSYCVSSSYFYISYKASRVYSYIVFATIHITVGLTIPLAGWLADIRFGRYKMIRFSMWTMWISSILLTASLVILQYLDTCNLSRILHIFIIPLAVGYGGFQANVIQFGVDQHCDAPSSEIKTFIIWYSWTFISSIATVSTALYVSKEYRLFVSLLISVKLTLAVTLSTLFNNVLIKEPVTQNPFKIVYGVIKYVMKHKTPRLRSAFTYTGEDGIPSRIDYGKSKYGGPFTTEQVEDVKMLFRVILVIVVGCAFYGMAIHQHSVGNNVRSKFINALSHPPEYVFMQ